jgi:RHS repeat-associated protein
MLSRTDNVHGFTENFSFDSIYRLTSSQICTLAGNCRDPLAMDYSAAGNILYKSDMGLYSYEPEHPHAAASIGNSLTLEYDVTGRLTSDSLGRQVQNYTYFDKPASIAFNGNQTVFFYGPSKSLAQSIEYFPVNSQLWAKVTTYIADVYERVDIISPDGQINSTTYTCIAGGGTTLFISQQQNSMWINNTFFMVRDHLHSIEYIIALDGQIVESYSYDVYGARRDVNTWDSIDQLSFNSSLIDHGFTDQQKLEGYGWIFMHARMYDPAGGHFLSADPRFDADGDSQEQNPYSYVLNNPLIMTDPMGTHWHGLHHLWHSIKHDLGSLGRDIKHDISVGAKIFKKDFLPVGIEILASIGATALCGGDPACGIAAASFISGVETKMEGGSLLQAFESAGVTALSMWVGGMKLPIQDKLLIDGTINGLSSVSQHGQFVLGFVAGMAEAGSSSSPAGQVHITVKSTLVKLVMGERDALEKDITTCMAQSLSSRMGLNLDEMDAGLELLSVLGGQRTYKMASGKFSGRILGGLTTHKYGALWLPFDVVDVMCVYQGLPSYTGWKIIFTGTGHDYTCGHSLGAAEIALLSSYNVAPKCVTLWALPLMAHVGSHADLIYNTGDFVSGTGIIEFLTHPEATFEYNGLGQHSMDSYGQKNDYVKQSYW